MSIEALSLVFKIRGLTLGQRMVLYHLADAANETHEHYEGRMVCWPSLSMLVKRTEMSRQGVVNMLSFLQENGYLIMETDHNFHRATGRGGKKTLYELPMDHLSELVNSVAKSENESGQLGKTQVVNCDEESGQLGRIIKNHKGNGKENRNSGDDQQPGFSLNVPDDVAAKPLDVMLAWNDQFKNTDIPAVQKMTEARERAFALRRKETGLVTLADWRGLFRVMTERPFLLGRNNTSWVATWDWVMKPGKIVAIMEGAYADKRRGNGRNGEMDDSDIINQIRGSLG